MSRKQCVTDKDFIMWFNHFINMFSDVIKGGKFAVYMLVIDLYELLSNKAATTNMKTYLGLTKSYYSYVKDSDMIIETLYYLRNEIAHYSFRVNYEVIVKLLKAPELLVLLQEEFDKTMLESYNKMLTYL